MKICFLATGYIRWKGDVDSAKNYLVNLAVELVNKGEEVHVVAPHAEGLKKYEIIDGVHIHRFQYLFPASLETLAYFPGMPEKIKTINGKMQVPFFFISMALKIVTIAYRYDIDVIVAHWATPPGFVAVLTKYLHKRPTIIGLYGAELFPFLNAHNSFASLCKFQIRYAIKHSDLVFGISNSTCDAGIQISGRKDIGVIPFGVDTSKFCPLCDVLTIKQKHHLLGKKILFSTGRMVERKGFRYLIEAFSLVLKSYPNTVLILGGDGPEKQNLKNSIMKLNIGNNVIFPGFIPDDLFPNYLKASDIFILPSITDRSGDKEGLGLVLVEAMACGTPVIGTNVGGITDIITDGYNGFLVPEKRSKELADKIVEMLNDTDQANYLSENGLKTVQKYFSWDSICIKYLTLFSQVSESKSDI